MQIIVNNKIVNLFSLFSDDLDLPLAKVKKHRLLTVDHAENNTIINLNDDFIYDLVKAITSVAVPFAGVIASSYALGELFGKKLDAIIEKYYHSDDEEEKEEKMEKKLPWEE